MLPWNQPPTPGEPISGMSSLLQNVPRGTFAAPIHRARPSLSRSHHSYQSFGLLKRFTTCDNVVSFMARRAFAAVRFRSGSRALSPASSHPADVAAKMSPSPISFGVSFSRAPPCGPLRCARKPPLCSCRKARRTITGLVPRTSAIAAEVCILPGSSASSARMRRASSKRPFIAIESQAITRSASISW